ncbi:hypothetical protein [Trinickia sp.]|uniref:hypothetical protein n=1 Tax=Trinickia sp. TaxID=2571163 RepID=UPI003F7D1AF2
MSRREYPYIGVDRVIKGNKQCHCCRQTAIRKVEIQVNWFRGDDEVFQLCELHYAFVGKKAWRELFAAAEAEKESRRKCNEHARKCAAERKARTEQP